MFLWDWIQTFLSYFGFNKKAKIVIIGLDNAGKSTLLNLLKTGQLKQFPPTNQARHEELSMGGLTIQAYDLGGHETMRRVWKDYFPAVDGIVFIIDSACHERLAEARTELQGLLENEMISEIPVVVLGNKTDKAEAVGKANLIMDLGIQNNLTDEDSYENLHLCTSPDPPTRTGKCRAFMCSLRMKQGYGDALRWLVSVVK